jgi:hypothetical protein
MKGYYEFYQDLDAMQEMYDEPQHRFPNTKCYIYRDMCDLNLTFLRMSPLLRLSAIQAEYELQSIPKKTYERFDECLDTLVKLEKEYIKNG